MRFSPHSYLLSCNNIKNKGKSYDTKNMYEMAMFGVANGAKES